jgi:GntR family transcriptional repressor for pyruvate dehydrogenase complex
LAEPAYAFEPVGAQRVSQGAAEQIAEAIHAGDLPVGARLPSERVLAVQMGVSRPTLRIALKTLADAGLVETRPGPAGGAFISSDVVPAALLHDAAAQPRVSEVAGVLEARRMLEPRVAQLAARYGTDEDFEALRRTIGLQRTADPSRLLALEERFHLALARATRNGMVVTLMRALLRRLMVARALTIRVPPDRERAVALHQRTLEAVTAGDPDAIEAAMDEHLGHLERIWDDESGRGRMRPIPPFPRG